MHSIIISQKPVLLTDDDAVHRNVSSSFPPVSLLLTQNFYLIKTTP